jgi:signal transduction histidine kinase
MSKFSSFFKENTQYFYSAILITLIPIFIIANTLWQMKISRDSLDYELTQNAITTQNLIGQSLSGIRSTTNFYQDKIDLIKNENKPIDEISVLNQTSSGFVVIASTNTQLLGVTITSSDYFSSWSQDSPISAINKNDSGSRELSIISPITNPETLQKEVMLNTKMSLTNIDTKTDKNFNFSLIVLAITIFLVLLLLANYFRFFQFAVLFKRLQEVDKMKDDFISVSSHELKTPMAAIKGYLAMMFEGIAGQYDAKTKVHLQKISDNVNRLDILVGELLDVSRLEQGRMQFDPQPYDISKVLGNSIKMFKDQASSKKLILKENKKENLPQVFIDPDRFQQVSDNLISNAIKYTIKGCITISYFVTKDYVSVSFKDSGIGMSMKDQKNLFTKFYRIRNEKTIDAPGTGLGLWIAKEIITRMDGKITVKSTENVGSEFIVTFPIMKES